MQYFSVQEEYWCSSSDSDDVETVVSSISPAISASARVFCIFISMWHALFNVSIK